MSGTTLKLLISTALLLSFSWKIHAEEKLEESEEVQVIYPSDIEALKNKLIEDEKILSIQNQDNHKNQYDRIREIIKNSDLNDGIVRIEQDHTGKPKEEADIIINSFKDKVSGSYDISNLISDWHGTLMFDKDKFQAYKKLIDRN